MVNAMTNEGNLQPSTRPRLIREVRLKLGVGIIGEDENLDLEAIEAMTERTLRRLLLSKGLSEEDMEFNLRMLHVWEIASRKIDLVSLIEERYGCGKIMALTLAVKETERCTEEVGESLEQMNHPQDEEALIELLLGLRSVRGLKYYPDLLTETRKVGALRSEPYAPRGQVVDYIEEPIYELIEARFALDAIWDGEASRKRGATEQNRQLAKRRAPELDTNPKVVKARRSLGIPRGGFKDVEGAFQWSQKWSPDWSRRDDAYWQEVVWWESFTWAPYLERVMGRGYIMLDLPAMNQAVQDLVDGYDYLGRAWYRALPFYFIRGRLEPPPRILHRARTKHGKHREILALWKKHQHDFKVVVSYNYGLTDADWEEIAEEEPAARLQYIRANAQATIQEAALKIANRNGTLRDEEEWISEANVMKVRSRMRVGKT